MAVSTRNSIVTNGLVLYLDAANSKSYVSGSTTWSDMSGNGYTGSLTGTPLYNSVNGGGIVFDGTNNTCPITSQTFNSTTGSSFTIELLFKRNSSTPQSFKGLYTMGNGTTTSNARIYFYFDNNNNGQMAINYFTTPGTDTYVVLNSQLLDTNYHHAVQVIDKNTLLMTGYFDGVNKGSGAINSSSTSDTVFRIGGTTSCNASVAILRIYNRALTQAEITQNYNATKTRFNLT